MALWYQDGFICFFFSLVIRSFMLYSWVKIKKKIQAFNEKINYRLSQLALPHRTCFLIALFISNRIKQIKSWSLRYILSTLFQLGWRKLFKTCITDRSWLLFFDQCLYLLKKCMDPKFKYWLHSALNSLIWEHLLSGVIIVQWTQF